MRPYAIGSFEAAALMGVHYTQPRKMVEKGLLSAHIIVESAYTDAPTRNYAIYSAQECEANWAEYDEKYRASGGKTERRPRSNLEHRPEALRRLKDIKKHIDFDDAIGLGEAAKVLGVHASFVPRLISSGSIMGRVAWNPRGATSRVYIVSRRSCQQNVKAIRAAEAAGTKKGRPRKKVS
jgi:hypothetical protein